MTVRRTLNMCKRHNLTLFWLVGNKVYFNIAFSESKGSLFCKRHFDSQRAINLQISCKSEKGVHSPLKHDPAPFWLSEGISFTDVHVFWKSEECLLFHVLKRHKLTPFWLSKDNKSKDVFWESPGSYFCILSPLRWNRYSTKKSLMNLIIFIFLNFPITCDSSPLLSTQLVLTYMML